MRSWLRGSQRRREPRRDGADREHDIGGGSARVEIVAGDVVEGARRLGEVRRWTVASAYNGLARSWFGWAWTWLVAVGRGRADDDPRTRATIAAWLGRGTHHADRHVGAFVGTGAGAVVAAALTQVMPSARALLDDEIWRWRASLDGDHLVDLYGGAAGALLAAAEIEARVPGAIARGFPAQLHDEVAAGLRASLADPQAPLGLAHGVAGLLLAVEAGCATFALALPGALREQAIDALMQRRLQGPRNIANWPVWRPGGPLLVNAWCNGAAGVALAAMAGHRMSGDAAYEPLIACALPSTFALRGDARGSFCCGAIGQAQTLVEAHRLHRDGWLRRARATAPLARGWHARNRTFHHGSLGADYLALRLAAPELPLPGLGALSA